MRRVNSKFEGQSDGITQDWAPQLELIENTAEPKPEMNAEFAQAESNAQQNVEQFKGSDLSREEVASIADDRDWSKSIDKPPVFDQAQMIYWIVGSLALMAGGIAILVRQNKKRNPKIYRARAGRLDSKREVRGQFKPSKRFKKTANTPAVASGDLAARAEVSALVSGQTEPALQKPALDSDNEFDFAEDSSKAGVEFSESKELVEVDPESLEVSNDAGSLSARPPESLQECGLSLVEPQNLHASHFVESSPAQLAATGFEYSGGPIVGFGEGSGLGDDSEQDLGSAMSADDPTIDANVESDIELEQEANEFAQNFFADDSNEHPVRAINEDEEAVMNLQDDDSDLEFDFDLGDDGELQDSDAEFNFEMDVDEVAGKSQSESAVGAAADVIDQGSAVSSAQAAEPIGDAAEFELDAQATQATGADIDDSGEFAAMFDDSSEDLGLELNAPAEPAVEAVSEVDDSEVDLAEFGLDDDDPVSEISNVADAVGDLGESVSEMAQDAVEVATEGVAESAGGLSDNAKAAAVAAGAAGAAAGGGFLSKMFGWGKKKKVADAETVQEAVEEVAMDDLSDEITVSEQIEVLDEVASVEDGMDIEAVEEVEFDLGEDSESDEFDFSLDDEAPEAMESSEDDSGIQIADDEIVAVQEVADQSSEEADSGIDLLGSDAEFDFADVDSDQNGDKKSFSSMETLRDPELAGDSIRNEGEKGFSSMDTLRDPEPDPVAAKSAFSSAETIRVPETTSEPESDGLGVAAVGGAALAGAAALVGLNKSNQSDQDDDELQTKNESLEVVSDSKNDALVAKIQELEQANSKLEESTKSLEEKLTAQADELTAKADELASKQEELATKEKELAAKVAESESENAAQVEQDELAAKVEELEQSNKSLNESAQLLEEKLETQAAESESAIAKVEQEYAAKLEESATGQSEMTTELESLKAELAEAKSSAAQAASEASEEKDAELEKMRADLQAAQSSDDARKQEIESLKQQLADATANQADDDDGMPTSSLMGAVGLGTAGLMGGKSLMDQSADPAPADSAAGDDLKKRFELRLKAERRARKDAQAHLEQAEEQRNEIAKTLRGLKKELVEAQNVAAVDSPASDDSPQLKALESQLERQSEKMKTLGAENDKLSAELKSAQDSIANLNTENSELKKKVK